MNLSKLATSRSLTVLGILTVVAALANAALAAVKGEPVNLEVTLAALSTGIGMILAKGQSNTGGTVPATDEAKARLSGATTVVYTGPTAVATPTTPQQGGFVRHGFLVFAAVVTLSAVWLVGAHARADEAPPPPSSSLLCAIGTTSSGKICFGFLPTLTAMGVDVHHGNVVAAANIGASIALTVNPGQLDSVTVGIHPSFQAGAAGGPPTTFNLGGTLSFLKGYATVIADWQAVGGDHAFIIAPALSLPALF